MSDRALLLRQRSSGEYEVYYAQHGGRRDLLFGAATGKLEPAALMKCCPWGFRSCHGRNAILNRLDFLSISALYVVTAKAVDAYRPVWLGVPTATDEHVPTPSWIGALVAVDSPQGVRRLETGTRWAKTMLGRGLESGVIEALDASRLLLLSLLPFRGWLHPGVPTLLA